MSIHWFASRLCTDPQVNISYYYEYYKTIISNIFDFWWNALLIYCMKWSVLFLLSRVKTVWQSSADQSYQINIKEILLISCLFHLKINAQSMNKRLYCLEDHTLMTCLHVYMYECRHTLLYMHIDMHVGMNVYVDMCLCMYMGPCMNVCMSLCVARQAWVYACIP